MQSSQRLAAGPQHIVRRTHHWCQHSRHRKSHTAMMSRRVVHRLNTDCTSHRSQRCPPHMPRTRSSRYLTSCQVRKLRTRSWPTRPSHQLHTGYTCHRSPRTLPGMLRMLLCSSKPADQRRKLCMFFRPCFACPLHRLHMQSSQRLAAGPQHIVHRTHHWCQHSRHRKYHTAMMSRRVVHRLNTDCTSHRSQRCPLHMPRTRSSSS